MPCGHDTSALAPNLLLSVLSLAVAFLFRFLSEGVLGFSGVNTK